MSFDRIGVNSLLAVNAWVGVINGNLQSANRTGYKTTRVNFTDGLGVNRVAGNLELPPSTLTVQSTKVEWGQGSVINSDTDTHFALQGDGFFVLHEEASNKYFVSRDGEFHWDNEGYLVNSSGLKVVSAGQDYIRYSTEDQSDIFHKDGYSAELETYGNKNFLLLDFANRDNLRMSKYGSTVFELDGNLTTRVNNDFSVSTDGITFVYDDPAIVPFINDPGLVFAPPALAADAQFTIDFGDNGPLTLTLTDTTTLEDIVTAIDGVGGVSAFYDDATDKLSIENTVASGGSNRISFSGPNGRAIQELFDLTNPLVQSYTTGGNDGYFIQSREDIDNSDENERKDIEDAPRTLPPFVGQNTFTTTPIVDLTTEYIADYTHNKQAGYVQADATGARAGSSMVLSQASTTNEFDVVMDLKVTDGGNILLAFGQSDPQSLRTGGFGLSYDVASGDVTLVQFPDSYSPTANPTILGTQNVGTFSSGAGTAALDADLNPSRMAIRLDNNAILTMSIDGGAVATFDMGSTGTRPAAGFMSLRNSSNILRVENLRTDFKNINNSSTTGQMVSVGLSDIANYEASGLVHGNRPRTYVTQNALESSEASLTEYIPMLSIAQKVFSSISKIISTHNLITDDLNTLIR